MGGKNDAECRKIVREHGGRIVLFAALTSFMPEQRGVCASVKKDTLAPYHVILCNFNILQNGISPLRVGTRPKISPAIHLHLQKSTTKGETMGKWQRRKKNVFYSYQTCDKVNLILKWQNFILILATTLHPHLGTRNIVNLNVAFFTHIYRVVPFAKLLETLWSFVVTRSRD